MLHIIMENDSDGDNNSVREFTKVVAVFTDTLEAETLPALKVKYMKQLKARIARLRKQKKPRPLYQFHLPAFIHWLEREPGWKRVTNYAEHVF